MPISKIPAVGINATGTPDSTTFFRGDNTWAPAGISDGDKGDITVSSSGTVWTIDNSVVTDAKLSLTANASNIKTAINASGSAPIYACRAWVNFNGTGTIAIRASGNVTSITDVGVGYYRVNFTTAMADVNYSIAGSASDDAVAATIVCTSGTWGGTSQTTTSALMFVGATGVAYDRTYVGINFFR